jgi:hypothetical protein
MGVTLVNVGFFSTSCGIRRIIAFVEVQLMWEYSFRRRIAFVGV